MTILVATDSVDLRPRMVRGFFLLISSTLDAKKFNGNVSQ